MDKEIGFIDFFKEIPDHRIERKKLHSVEEILNAVRQHWGVENKLHWILDIAFGDDQSRIRKGNAPRNIAIIKKTALNLLQIIKRTRPRVGLKAMRKLAGWDHDFLNSVLIARF